MSVAVAIACPEGVVIACDSAAGDDGQVTNLARIKFARSSNGAFIAAWTGALCYQEGTVQVESVVQSTLDECEKDSSKTPKATAQCVGQALVSHRGQQDGDTFLLLGGRNRSTNPELWYVEVTGQNAYTSRWLGDTRGCFHAHFIGDRATVMPSLGNCVFWPPSNLGALTLMHASRVCREAVYHVINDPKVPLVAGVCTVLCVEAQQAAGATLVQGPQGCARLTDSRCEQPW